MTPIQFTIEKDNAFMIILACLANVKPFLYYDKYTTNALFRHIAKRTNGTDIECVQSSCLKRLPKLEYGGNIFPIFNDGVRNGKEVIYFDQCDYYIKYMKEKYLKNAGKVRHGNVFDCDPAMSHTIRLEINNFSLKPRDVKTVLAIDSVYRQITYEKNMLALPSTENFKIFTDNFFYFYRKIEEQKRA